MNGEGGEATEGLEEGKGKKKKEDHEDGCISGERETREVRKELTSRLRLEPLR